MTAVVAALPGRCPVCEERYEVGTVIIRHLTGWGHASCPAETPLLDVCQVCWIAPCTC